MTSLINKTALVTGASHGMDARALALAAAGARVIVDDDRKADEAKVVVGQIRAAGARADAVPADFAAPDGVHGRCSGCTRMPPLFQLRQSDSLRLRKLPIIDQAAEKFVKGLKGGATEAAVPKVGETISIWCDLCAIQY